MPTIFQLLPGLTGIPSFKAFLCGLGKAVAGPVSRAFSTDAFMRHRSPCRCVSKIPMYLV